LPEYGPICDLGCMAKRPPSPPAEPVPESLRELFGVNLRRERERQGISQKDLAAATDLSQSLISLIESGKSGASLEAIEALAKAVGCCPSDLLKRPKPSRRR
jgi:ribosome-binding protein aMBF1 (putative translation factor)